MNLLASVGAWRGTMRSEMEPPRYLRSRLLSLHPDDADALATLKALASRPRLRILELLSDQLLNLSELAEALDMPLSTTNLHVGALERAGLLLTEQRPGIRGSQKLSTRAFDHVVLRLPHYLENDGASFEIAMPVGAYVDSRVAPTCGLASEHHVIGLADEPASFYDPARLEAQIVWFHGGHVEYRFPQRLPAGTRATELSLSLEVCSEAPLHHNDWPSDITVWMNGIDVGTWRSPADFGGQPGRLTPAWWSLQSSQYGLRKVWRITRQGASIDGLAAADATVDDLDLHAQPYVSVRIGVKDDAHHRGGVNIFGARFGNYPQDIVLHVRHEAPTDRGAGPGA